MRILVYGDIAYDMFLHYEGSFSEALGSQDLRTLSISFPMPKACRAYGGNCVNIAWNLKLLGLDPLPVSAVGSDGDEYLSLLKKRKIDTSEIDVLKDMLTATAIIGTDNDNRQITFFHSGASGVRQWKVPKKPKEISYAIIGPSLPPLTLAALAWCKKQKIPVIFDPGQKILAYTPEELLQAMELATGVMANAYEATLISTRLNMSPEKMAKQTGFLIVTKGEEGFTLYEDRKVIGFPRCNADKIVNPTGAGDAFRAAFIAGMLSGWDHVQAAQLGAAFGSFIVEQEEALLDSFNVKKLMERAEGTYGALPALKIKEQ